MAGSDGTVRRKVQRKSWLAFAALAALLIISMRAGEFWLNRVSILQPTTLAPTATGGGEVLLIGDSRVAQWPAPAGWAKAGYSGQSVIRIAGVAPTLLRQQAYRTVVIQAGINDLTAICLLPLRERDPAQARSVAAVSSIVASARSLGVVPVVTLVVPPIEPDLARRLLMGRCLQARIPQFNASLLSLRGRGVRVIDLSPALRQGDGWGVGVARNDLHWTAAAYERLTDLLQSELALR